MSLPFWPDWLGPVFKGPVAVPEYLKWSRLVAVASCVILRKETGLKNTTCTPGVSETIKFNNWLIRSGGCSQVVVYMAFTARCLCNLHHTHSLAQKSDHKLWFFHQMHFSSMMVTWVWWWWSFQLPHCQQCLAHGLVKKSEVWVMLSTSATTAWSKWPYMGTPGLLILTASCVVNRTP